MIHILPRTSNLHIRVYHSGEICLTAALVKRMNIKPGEKIALCSNKDELFLAISPIGVPLRIKKHKCAYICSTTYARRILRNQKQGIFRIGEDITIDNTTYHTIIFKKNYHNGK